MGNCEGVGVSIAGGYAMLSQKLSRSSDDAVELEEVEVPPFNGEVSTVRRADVEKAVLSAINRERERSGLPPLVLDEGLSKRVLEELREIVGTLSVAGSSGTVVIPTKLRDPREIAEDVLEVLRFVPAGRDLWVRQGRLGVAALEATEAPLPDGRILELGVVWVGIKVVEGTEGTAEKGRPRRVPSYVVIAVPLCRLIARRQTFFTDRLQRRSGASR
ncbi:CAP domain-containing protein [Methanopyrus sp.]